MHICHFIAFCLLLPFAAWAQNVSYPSYTLSERQQALESCVLLQDEGEHLPFRDLSLPTASYIWDQQLQPFQDMLGQYMPCERLTHLSSGRQYGRLVVALRLDAAPAIDSLAWLGMQAVLQQAAQPVLVVFGQQGASLAALKGIAQVPALLYVAGYDSLQQEVVAQMLFGAEAIKGRLRQELPPFVAGSGLSREGGLRMSYTVPEAVGWNGERLRRRLDSIVAAAIAAQAFPGCQLLVAKDGKVVHHQAYGYHTYQQQQAVQLSDLYDLASITKVSAPLPALMKLLDEGKFELDVPLARYWPDWQRRKDKRELRVRDILAHQARLMPYIVYWRNTLNKKGRFKRRTFLSVNSGSYQVPVSPDLYLHQAYQRKIYKAIRKSSLNPEPGYVYSGLAFLIFPRIVEQLSGQAFEAYVQNEFYRPLGADNLGYNPWKRFPLSRLVPTEKDTFFRKRLVQGWVHDEAAAMFGGVSGNAGLFSNANDLAKLFAMYMNMGQYGGRRYVREVSMRVFSRYQFPERGNRRGLGFDKPALTEAERANGYVSPLASACSFGHSGFTGTLAWADPKHQLLFILLSNRVYPTRENRKLYSLSIRPALHSVLYDEIRLAKEE
ncbi:MAG: penicillin-binding protein [Bacteroidetes bacterium]|nr:MAG: penicillin-binding protein [Bacteroidota bacterium]